MGLKGRLTKAGVAATMPVDAPVYRRKPFYFKSTRLLRCDYETDAEAAAGLIPEQSSLSDPPTAFFLING